MYKKFTHDVVFQKRYVSRNDLDELIRSGGTVEELLDFIGDYGDLMIGSSNSDERIKNRGIGIYATRSGSNALVEALFEKNERTMLNYKFVKGDPKLAVGNLERINYQGFVHIVDSKANFYNSPPRSKQWASDEPEVKIDISIDVKINDFKYKHADFGKF